jgi:hypothetical protein
MGAFIVASIEGAFSQAKCADNALVTRACQRGLERFLRSLRG